MNTLGKTGATNAVEPTASVKEAWESLHWGPTLLDCSSGSAAGAGEDHAWLFRSRTSLDLRIADCCMHDAWGGAVLLSSVGQIAALQEFRLVQRLRRRFPALPILLLGQGDSLGAASLADALSASYCVRGSSLFVEALTKAAREAARSSIAGRVIDVVVKSQPMLDDAVGRFVALASQSDRKVRNVHDCARWLGLSVRNLERKVRDAGFPEPWKMFWAIQVCRAVSVLQDPESTLKTVVASLPFRSASATKARVRDYFDGVIPELGTPTGLDRVLLHFQEFLDATAPRASRIMLRSRSAR